MFCKKCGNEMLEETKFCNGCGSPNEASAVAETVETVEAVTSTEQTETTADVKVEEVTESVESVVSSTESVSTGAVETKDSILNSVRPQKGASVLSNVKAPDLSNMKAPDLSKIKVDASKLTGKVPSNLFNKKVVAIAGGTLAVVLLAGVFVWNSNTVVLGRAINKTSDAMVDEFLDNAKMLPVVNHLDDMTNSTYHMNITVAEGRDEIDLDMKLNFKKSEYEVTTTMYNMELATVKLSEKYLTVESEALTDTIGLNVQDLQKEYLGSSSELVEMVEDLYDAALDIGVSEVTRLVKNMDLEKGSSKATIDGKSVSTKTFTTTITPELMEEFYEDVFTAISKDKTVSKYLQAVDKSSSEIFGTNIDTDDILDMMLDEMIYSLRYMSDMEITFHVYKGYIVAVEYYNGYSELELALSSVKNLLEGITISYDGEVYFEVSNTVKNNKYTLSSTEYGSYRDYYTTFEYDGDKSRNNATYSTYWDSVSFTMTEPKKNELELSFVYEDRWDEYNVDIESSKGSISKYSFSIDKKFVDIMDLIDDYGFDFLDRIIDYRAFY